MKEMTAVVLSLLVLAACASGPRDPAFVITDENQAAACRKALENAVQRTPAARAALNSDKAELQDLMEELITTRAESIRLAREYSQAASADAPIPSELLDRLKRRLKSGPALADRMVALINPYACWLAADPAAQKAAGLPPLEPDLRIEGVVISLAGGLSLYDTYLAVAAVMQEDDKLRQFLNQADMGYGIQENQLDAVTESFLSLSALQDVRARITFYRQSRERIDQMAGDDRLLAYLSGYIDQSPSHVRLSDVALADVAGQAMEAGRQSLVDDLAMMRRESVNGLSRIFGNATGMVESRSGKLYGSIEVESDVAAVLEPGDILLEKTPFRLTDRLIPGHWGHAAVWIGTEAQLTRMGVWNHPVMVGYHEQIRAGRSVVEALRDGVQVNPLAHFLNIDDLAVLRTNDGDADARKTAVILALRQVGKTYDFNFDVETTDRIVCSELVYLAYPRVPWDTQRMAGRYTISPDAVAVKALAGGPLDVVILYHDGTRVTGDQQTALRRLLESGGSLPQP
jgi:uncharacterized protein YycO